MSFDLIATILFVLLFVVGPLLQRRGRDAGQGRPQGRGQGGGPGRGQAPGQEGKPPPPADTRASTRQGELPRTGADEAEGPLSQRLEEARRRVLEAMGEQQESGRQKTAQARPQQRQELDWQDPALNWQEVVKPVDSFIARPAKPSTLRGASGEVISAPPLRTERRRKARPPAKLAVGSAFGTSAESIMNGFIWHEILSEPVSKRGTRRQPSRLRSR